MKAKLKYKGKEIEIPDVEKVSGIGKYTGLMLKKENALLFEFEKGRKAIHSLFCPDFLAIWLDGSRIVDYQIITSAKLKIIPQENFNKLLEIPLNNKYSSVVEFFLREEKFK
jgi:hypothetical protein